MNRSRRRWILPVLLMGIIFIASSIPGNDLPGLGLWDTVVKKGGHMLGYALLAAAFFHALNDRKRSLKLVFLLAFFAAALYGAVDEFHQRFTPGRSASLGDVAVDATGAFIGSAVSHFLLRRRFT